MRNIVRFVAELRQQIERYFLHKVRQADPYIKLYTFNVIKTI